MVYVFGDYELDDRLYTLRCADESLKLEPKVFEALEYLIRYRDRFVSRDELMEKLWPGQVVGEAALTQCIAKARKAVHDDGGKQRVIKTYHGRGYRFVAEVMERGDKPPPLLRQAQDERDKAQGSMQKPFVLSPLRLRSGQASILLRTGLSKHEGSSLPIQLSFQMYWHVGHLVLVGFFLFFGVMMTLRHFSSRPSFLDGEEYTTKEETTLEATLVEKNQRRLWLLSANSPEASAYCLRGWDYYSRFTPEANIQARQMFERAVAADPRYATAYVGLGWTYLLEWSSFWTHDSQSLEQALALAQKALVLDNSLPYAHTLLGTIYLQQKQHEQAIAEGERAIALDPTCADCYVTLADILTFAGRPRRAIELVEVARYLDPSSAAYYAAVAGRAYYSIGQPDQAIPALRRALIRNPNFLLTHLNLVLAYSELGFTKAAKAELSKGQKLNPQLSLASLRERLPDKNPRTTERFLNALRKAGLNEE